MMFSERLEHGKYDFQHRQGTVRAQKPAQFRGFCFTQIYKKITKIYKNPCNFNRKFFGQNPFPAIFNNDPKKRFWAHEKNYRSESREIVFCRRPTKMCKKLQNFYKNLQKLARCGTRKWRVTKKIDQIRQDRSQRWSVPNFSTLRCLSSVWRPNNRLPWHFPVFSPKFRSPESIPDFFKRSLGTTRA